MPMNEAMGIVLVGSLNGTMISGATLVPGLVGKGVFLRSEESKVDFGDHPSDCFYDPDICGQGVTFGIWIKTGPVGYGGLLLDTGAEYDSGKGK